jgi:hypothetical protein
MVLPRSVYPNTSNRPHRWAAADLELHVRRLHTDATRRLVDEIKSPVDRRLG